uniref:Adaptor related protein complex 1 subunit sigma 1 n=4 Tax=Eutheria TaxID=9347 RepID=F7BWU2_HORSE
MRSRGSRPLPQGSRPRNRGAGACWPREAARSRVSKTLCPPPALSGAAACGESGVWEGIVSRSESGCPASGCRPALSEAGLRWESQMRFMLLFSRQGKLRLQKWYLATSDKERKKMVRELMQVVLARKPKMCSFLEWRDLKVVYKRYASLYFCCAIEGQDNELITLELIHRYVELLDKYFGSVCELDIIFNFEKAYFILDEFLMGGDVQDTSKKSVLKAIEQADLLQEEDESPRSVLEEMGLA